MITNKFTVILRLQSDIDPDGYFIEDGLYTQKNSFIQTYIHDNGCTITEIKKVSSCGTFNCRKSCNVHSGRKCFEVIINSSSIYACFGLKSKSYLKF